MVFAHRYKRSNELQPVHIFTREIQLKYFNKDLNTQIDQLIAAGELSVIKKTKGYFYEALKPGGYDLNLLPSRPLPADKTSQAIIRNLQCTSLIPNSPSTDYFNHFLRYKSLRPDLFFIADRFCGRIHTPVSSFYKEYRKNILINDEATTGLDVATMQPLLLGKILREKIGRNDFSTWIDDGTDIYKIIQEIGKIELREDAKKFFFRILFSKPSEELSNTFGNASWITWVNDFKRLELSQNPHNKLKLHSNLAWLLSTTEVQLMRQVWHSLRMSSIPFVTIHDEVIVQRKHAKEAFQIFSEIMNKEFSYFKIKSSENV